MNTLQLRSVYDFLPTTTREYLITYLNIRNPVSDIELCIQLCCQENIPKIRFIFYKTLTPLPLLAPLPNGLNMFEYYFPKSMFDVYNKITVLNDSDVSIKLNEYNIKNGFMYIPPAHVWNTERRKITIYSSKPHIDIEFDAILISDNYERNKLIGSTIYDVDNNLKYSEGVLFYIDY